MHRNLKFLVGLFAPYSVVRYFQVRAAEKAERIRRQKLAGETARTQMATGGYSYAAALRELVGYGIEGADIHAASLFRGSLELCAQTLERYLVTDRPVVGLHIGNYLGVSLCFFLDWMKRTHPDGLVISIDPNIAHQGVENPQQYVTRLAEHFGLTRQHVLIVGYTLEKNMGDGNDSASEAKTDASMRQSHESAPEDVLPHLARLGVKIDFVLIDGNHDAAYLTRELQWIEQMLNERAILIFDDVSEYWARMQNVYETLASGREYVEVGRDSRLGILIKQKRDGGPLYGNKS